MPPTLAHNTVETRINTIQLRSRPPSARDHHGDAGPGAGAKDPSIDRESRLAPLCCSATAANTAGRAPLRKPRPGAERQVPIHTIAYGTENGYVDLDGKREPVPVDHVQMQQIAEVSRGQYFRAATPEQLKTVYANIGSQVGYEKADREVTARFAGYGLAFAVLAALGAISLGAKWP